MSAGDKPDSVNLEKIVAEIRQVIDSDVETHENPPGKTSGAGNASSGSVDELVLVPDEEPGLTEHEIRNLLRSWFEKELPPLVDRIMEEALARRSRKGPRGSGPDRSDASG